MAILPSTLSDGFTASHDDESTNKREFRDPVCLNVGGTRYSASLSTLTRYPDSMLGRMFGGEWPTRLDDDGAVFVDRDGRLFRYVLNFLRSDRLSLPRRFDEWDGLESEADFYQIAPMIDDLKRRRPKDPISLNVGGMTYATSAETLMKYPESFLGCVYVGDIRTDVDSEGRIFIDRDGVSFRHVLNFMRDDRLLLPNDFRELEQLKEEAVFYQISDLIEALNDFPAGKADTIIQIYERSDCDSIMVHAPAEILNHPQLPFNPTIAPSSHLLAETQSQRSQREELRFYRDRGFCEFRSASKTRFCQFLKSIGCEYLDSSMAMTTVGNGIVTKETEKWSAKNVDFG